MEWKKVSKNQYDNISKKQRLIIQGDPLTRKYDLLLYTPGRRKTLVNFRTKAEALKEANKFMKKRRSK